MAFLRFLEELRSPALDAFFSFATHFGEETVFMVLGLVFFWCINKKQGYYLLFVGFIGTIINQFLKLWFRIPRPWVSDPDFTIVETARAEATGYSFPSGHTQTAVGAFGAVARMRRERWARVVAIIVCVLVPLSRMYLGVHTPLDVGIGIAVATALVLILYPLMNKAMEKPAHMRILIGVMAAMTVAYVLFVELYAFPADIDMHNYESGLKNGYKMLGCFAALWLTYEVDIRWTHFQTRATPLAQVLKVIFGLAGVLLIKTFAKAPLYALCGGALIADGIRYFLLAAFAGAVWPITFPLFAKIGKKAADADT